jgi:hypothetical protein
VPRVSTSASRPWAASSSRKAAITSVAPDATQPAPAQMDTHGRSAGRAAASCSRYSASSCGDWTGLSHILYSYPFRTSSVFPDDTLP